MNSGRQKFLLPGDANIAAWKTDYIKPIIPTGQLLIK